jgi:plasmid maintenance system antidote protein VapI
MPPKTRTAPPIDDQLRAAIADDDRGPYRLAIDCGVDERMIRRFLARQRDLTMASAARIAAALGLQLRRR